MFLERLVLNEYMLGKVPIICDRGGGEAEVLKNVFNLYGEEVPTRGPHSYTFM